MITEIATDKAPKAFGPYSQAIAYADLLFCSGQIGTDPKTGELADGVEKQVKQILKNIKAVLAEADSSIDNVVKTTIFLTDMNDYTKVNEIYAEVFKDQKPARSTVQVVALPKGALVEIEVIAVLNEDEGGCCGGGGCGCRE